MSIFVDPDEKPPTIGERIVIAMVWAFVAGAGILLAWVAVTHG